MADHSDTHDAGKEPQGVLEYALLLADLGYRVFPCLPLRKEPAIKAWQNHATVEPRTIRSWFSEFPDRNLAIACGPQPNGMNLLVIDIDVHHGGLESWRNLITLHGDMGMRNTAIHSTPHGGFHLFLDAPAGFRNSRNKLGPGIDTRCEGGYVLVPPSAIIVDSAVNNYIPRTSLWPE